MSDIKLFRTKGNQVEVIKGHSVAIEKSLQTLIEKNLETFLGIRLVDSEHSTGKSHGGRIDTLGIDENDCPVIIEYKRSLNENVINQGLYYLDWLLESRAEFVLLAQKIDPKLTSESIDWNGARLICIAGEFTKFDEHAIKQIDHNIELIRYRRYGDEFLLLELVNSSFEEDIEKPQRKEKGRHRDSESVVLDKLAKASTEIKDRYEHLKAFMQSLGDDVEMKTLKHYFAFKRIKNFACVEIQPQNKAIIVYVKADNDKVAQVEGFIRDTRDLGHYGTGDLEITVRTNEDLEKAKPYILKSYEEN